MDYSRPVGPRELDQAIIAWIREFGGATFADLWYDRGRNIRGCGVRFVKNRMTLLRKAGRITYSRRTRKWTIVPCA